MRRNLFVFLGCFLAFASVAAGLDKGLTVKGVRHFSYAGFTRIVLELEAAASYTVNRTPDGQTVLLAAYEGPLVLKAALPQVSDGVVAGIEVREDAGRTVIAVHLDAAAKDVKDFVLRSPDRIVLDVSKGQAREPVAEPKPSTRQFVIMLDPGHGGRDSGIATAQGLEKTATLDMAQAVRKLLQKDPKLKVLLTRDRDAALSLDERATAANNAGAGVFVSFHLAPAGRGTRVYIQDPDEGLNEQARRPLTRDFLGFESGSEQQENLWGRQQAAHSRGSGVLGRLLARRLTGTGDAEPTQAPLAGLKPVNAVAAFVEIGSDQDRAGTEEAIVRGIEDYAGENR